ncbi:MAG: type II toxin-antitoxin system RelE/ParE family toxin [Lachnospiraceae bacterium]|nr:type II toxin-antitoxin system RelE/ParE family toxin [Lachnospiraceae bacterium]
MIIEIQYKSSKLKNICHDFSKAKKEFGTIVAEKLHALINLLENAETLNDINAMQIYNLHHLLGKRKGEYALDLGRRLGYRLIITPLDDNGNKWKEKDINVMYKSTKIVLILEVSNHYE